MIEFINEEFHIKFLSVTNSLASFCPFNENYERSLTEKEVLVLTSNVFTNSVASAEPSIILQPVSKS